MKFMDSRMQGKLLTILSELLEKPERQFGSDIVDLASKFLTKCDESLLLPWLNVLNWAHCVQLTHGAVGYNRLGTLNKWRFTPLYQDASVLSKSDLIVGVSRTIFQPWRDSGEKLLDGAMEHLPQLCPTLQKENLDILLLTILINWSTSFHSSIETMNDINEYMVPTIKILLRKLITARQLDIAFGLGLLCTLDHEIAIQWIYDALQSYKKDYHKLGLVTKLGATYAGQLELKKEKQYFLEMHTKCVWASWLLELEISYRDAFIDSKLDAVAILKKIMHHKKANIKSIEQMCLAFGLDLQAYLPLYLETTVLSWEPEFEVKITSDGQKEAIVKNNEKSIVKKCIEIASRMEDKCTLQNCLESLWMHVNYYFYEMYICLDTLLERISKSTTPSNHQFLLLFLKKYKRVRPPKQEEVQIWLDAFPESFDLPAIAEWRLPYLPLVQTDPWKIIKPELNLSTYKQWLCTASALKMDTNTICSVAVKGTLAAAAIKHLKGSQVEWCLQEENTSLSEIDNCISLITNLEIASAAQYYVMSHMDPGADKVKAAQLCLLRTMKWASVDNSQYAQECINKVQREYIYIGTTHVLHKYNLGSPHYIKLSSNAAQLIVALYQDARIIERGRGTVECCPDINGAAEEIAALHNIKLLTICRDLLNEWLLPIASLQNGSLDDNTATMTSRLWKYQKLVQANEENQLRACYLLKWGSDPLLTKYLIHQVFSKDSESCVSFKLQALQCLISVMAVEDLKDCVLMDSAMIKCYLQSLQYTCELESLGIVYSVEEFEACNKYDLVNSVLADQAFNPLASLLVAQLCLEYTIHNMNIWDSLLSQMILLGMVEELEEVLLLFTEHSPAHLKAWNYILLKPFVKAEIPLSEEQTKACLHSLALLQSCPLLSSVNVMEMGTHCLQLNVPHIAAALLPFLHKNQQNNLKEKILSSCSTEDLVEEVKILTQQGILTVPKILQILQEPTTH